MDADRQQKIKAYEKKYKRGLALYYGSIFCICIPVMLFGHNKRLLLIAAVAYMVYFCAVSFYVYSALPVCPLCGKNMRAGMGDVPMPRFSRVIVPDSCPHCGREIKNGLFFKY